MKEALRRYVGAIHATRTMASVIISGGGGAIASHLLSVPGCSGTLIDLVVPYSKEATIDAVGFEPKKYVSDPAAIDLSHAAFCRALRLHGANIKEDDAEEKKDDDAHESGNGKRSDDENSEYVPPHIVGVGCTAALVSVAPRRGLHAVRAATWTHYHHDSNNSSKSKSNKSNALVGKVVTTSLVMSKEAGRTRDEEDLVASLVALCALGDACGVPRTAGIDDAMAEQLRPDLGESMDVTAIGPTWPALLGFGLGASSVAPGASVVIDKDGTCNPSVSDFFGGHFVGEGTRGKVVAMPGSFNPVHEGHVKLLEAATEVAANHNLGNNDGKVTGVFELTVCNADKGNIEEDDLRKRTALLRFTEYPTVLTRATLFVDKLDVFPKEHDLYFAIGYDTAVRVVNKKYYGNTEEGLAAVLDALRARNARFLVAGRATLGPDKIPDPSLPFLTLRDIDLPRGYENMFVEIPESAFRSDLSSTSIRLGK